MLKNDLILNLPAFQAGPKDSNVNTKAHKGLLRQPQVVIPKLIICMDFPADSDKKKIRQSYLK